MQDAASQQTFPAALELINPRGIDSVFSTRASEPDLSDCPLRHGAATIVTRVLNPEPSLVPRCRDTSGPLRVICSRSSAPSVCSEGRIVVLSRCLPATLSIGDIQLPANSDSHLQTRTQHFPQLISAPLDVFARVVKTLLLSTFT